MVRATGEAIMNTGQVIASELLQGIVVEPNGTMAYVAAVANYANRQQTRNFIYKIDLATRNHNVTSGVGADALLVPFTGRGGPIKVYENNAQFPAGATAEERAMMQVPVSTLALKGETIYAADSLAGRIVMYDRTTGAVTREIGGIPLARGIAVGDDGKIWVGCERSKVRVYGPTWALLGTPITNLVEIGSICLSNGRLLVADRGASRILKYAVSGASVSLEAEIGGPASPGSRAFDRFAGIRGIAADAAGNLFVTDRTGHGARMQKLNSSLSGQTWEQLGLEFASSATFSPNNPNLVFSSGRQAYEIDRATGAWTYLGNAATDREGVYFGNFLHAEGGPPRMASLNGSDYYYFPTQNSGGLGVYRVVSPTDVGMGPRLELVACLGQNKPLPDGTIPPLDAGGSDTSYLEQYRHLWSWHSLNGEELTGAESAGLVHFKSPQDLPFFCPLPLFRRTRRASSGWRAMRDGSLREAISDQRSGSFAGWLQSAG